MKRITLDGKNQKLNLVYPCLWVYKVIGSHPIKLRKAIDEVIQGRHGNITLSNSSTKGKYHCFNLEMRVDNEESRMTIYEGLRKHPAIKIVL